MPQKVKKTANFAKKTLKKRAYSSLFYNSMIKSSFEASEDTL